MRNILFFDDSLSLSATIPTLFKRLDYNVYNPSSFMSAQEFIEKDPGVDYFDFIVVDLNIPYNNKMFNEKEIKEIKNISSSVPLAGWVWLKKIIKNHPGIESKIIILSAYVDEIPEVEKKEYHMLRFIPKGPKESLESIENIIR